MATKKGEVLQDLVNKYFKDVKPGQESGLYQAFFPKQLKWKYSAPIVAVPALAKAGKASMGARDQAVGVNSGLRKLSNMTDSVLGADPDANTIINPYIKAMNDTSSRAAQKRARRIQNNIQHPITTSDKVGGEIVFALHNLR